MKISLKKQLSMLVVALGFAALEASLSTTSVARQSHARHRSASAERIVDRGSRGTWNNPNYGYAAAPFRGPRHYHQTPLKTVLWTIGPFRVTAALDNGPSSEARKRIVDRRSS
jgi:hypothetical protein